MLEVSTLPQDESTKEVGGAVTGWQFLHLCSIFIPEHLLGQRNLGLKEKTAEDTRLVYYTWQETALQSMSGISVLGLVPQHRAGRERGQQEYHRLQSCWAGAVHQALRS